MKNQKIETIVNGMLAMAKGATARELKVKDIKEAMGKLNAMERDKFDTSLMLAQDFFKLKPKFDEFCKAVKDRLKDEGFTAKELPNQADIVWLVYGVTKSWFHRLLKVGALDRHIVNKFNDKCDEMEANGETPTRSIDALNTWAKTFDEHKGEADTDGETISELRANKGEKREILWIIKEGKKTLTFFGDGDSETNFTPNELDDLLVSITALIKTKYPKPRLNAKNREKLDAIQKAKKPQVVNKLLK
jgi:hypothetical protein